MHYLYNYIICPKEMISEANVMLRMFSLFNDAFLIIILSLSLSL